MIEFTVVNKVGVIINLPSVPHRYGNSHATWDHTVLPATRQRCHSRLTPAEAGTRLSDPREGCKAELT